MSTRVRYLGKRDFQIDDLFKTGLAWQGEGDVQLVEDEEKAKKMVELCPLTYQIVPDTEHEPSKTIDKGKKAADMGDPMMQLLVPESLKEGNPNLVPARNASRLALVKFAESLGMSVQDNRTREEILEDLELVLEDSTRVKSSDDLRAKESDEHAHEKQTIGVLVEYMMGLKEKPSVNVCRKIKSLGKIGLKTLKAPLRDRAWDESRVRLAKKEFETVDTNPKSESKLDTDPASADSPASSETETF